MKNDCLSASFLMNARVAVYLFHLDELVAVFFVERTWIHVEFLCSRQHYFNFSQRWPLVLSDGWAERPGKRERQRYMER